VKTVNAPEEHTILHNEDLDELMQGAQMAFFDSMLAGYADTSGSRIDVETRIDGEKMTRFPSGSFVVIDRWFVSPESESGKSVGTTVILHNNRPVWYMTYGGMYPKNVTSFLKESLATAYRRMRFVGGRGELRHTNGVLVYTNHVEKNSFLKFCGAEFIHIHGDTEPTGHHHYRGGSFV